MPSDIRILSVCVCVYIVHVYAESSYTEFSDTSDNYDPVPVMGFGMLNGVEEFPKVLVLSVCGCVCGCVIGRSIHIVCKPRKCAGSESKIHSEL